MIEYSQQNCKRCKIMKLSFLCHMFKSSTLCPASWFQSAHREGDPFYTKERTAHWTEADIKIHTQEWTLEWTQGSADKQSGRHSSRVLGLRAELQRQSSRHLVGMRRHKRSSTQGRRLGVQNPDISGQHPIILGHRQFVNALALFALKVQLMYYCDVPLISIAKRGAREKDWKVGEQKDLKSAN